MESETAFTPFLDTSELDVYAEQSLEVLEAKLAENKQSLAIVRDALALSSNEPELITLVKDIEELVVLYQDLVDLRRTQQSAPRIEDESLRLNPWMERAEDVTSDHLPDTTHPEDSLQLLRRTCYAYYEGELYTAFVVSVLDMEIPPKVTVEYIGWGNKETLPLQDVKFVSPTLPNNPLCRSGTHCWAIKVSDGLWHTAALLTVNSHNLVVQFTSDNETATLPFDWVSLVKPVACEYNQGAGQSRNAKEVRRPKRAAREIITPGGYRIPDALRINPQDTERVRQIKKKKISLLKKEQRREVIEAEARSRQINWKSHAAATAKKNRTFTKKESIFTTSHAPDAKVGVTGSGKGMTHFVTRSKHIFQEDIDEEV